MKAIVCSEYGPPEVLQFTEIPKPTPLNHEVLIKIYATTVHVGDTRIRKANPFLVRLVYGLVKPKKGLILGLEIAGVIESVGAKVNTFKVGDEVFAFTGFGLGGYAEYRCLPVHVKKGKYEKNGLVAIKPKTLTFSEAAAVPAACLTALRNLRKANLQPGQNILINGASGSLGTYAIQLAKHFGAQVTAVCSGKNFELVRSLGADHTIDYTQQDFTQVEDQFDVVYDAVMKSKRSRCQRILKPGGVYLNNNGLTKIELADLIFIKELIERNELKPVIDKTFAMDEVIQAHRYVDLGHKRGNVVLVVKQDI